LGDWEKKGLEFPNQQQIWEEEGREGRIEGGDFQPRFGRRRV
jgi:hypothetical protein